MSEQKNGYMAELDRWVESTVITPLFNAWHDSHSAPDEVLEEMQQERERAEAAVKKAVREKVLQSYRNGQGAGPRRQRRPSNTQHAQAHAG